MKLKIKPAMIAQRSRTYCCNIPPDQIDYAEEKIREQERVGAEYYLDENVQKCDECGGWWYTFRKC